MGVGSLLESQDQEVFGLPSYISNPIVAFLFGFPVPAFFAIIFSRYRPDRLALMVAAINAEFWYNCCLKIFLVISGEEVEWKEEDEAGDDRGGQDNRAEQEITHGGQNRGVMLGVGASQDASNVVVHLKERHVDEKLNHDW
eukprot:CAMPEP_0167767854 /NCGR_PEP_ID=MMETSP0110_2-20121227/16305_1 /TAXON_ID=629695 /ORGANISM="Gymnochlora sp., Strain CCMP2014" /LENGTH=140 /DNA_ID=CAMNT_0007656387 /DNA_START=118 /DNA_END=537 /DNA_ORIENTATION=-